MYFFNSALHKAIRLDIHRPDIHVAALSLLVLFCSLVANPCHATTLQFENVVTAGQQLDLTNTTYEEGGYDLYAQWAIITAPDTPSASQAGPASSSDFLSLCGCGGNVLMTHPGSIFSVTSLDLGIGSWMPSELITIQGTADDWTTSNFTVTIADDQWHTIALPANDPVFSHLQSLEISVSDGSFNGVAVDNIVVSAVPLPSSAWLFGSALFALTSLRNRHRRFWQGS